VQSGSDGLCGLLADPYVDEMCFWFNNRKNPYLFRDTILKLIQTPNLEYKELTATVQKTAA
jgi:hypothetical protein